MDQAGITRRADDAAVAEAARIIRAGGVVAFPTDTVYGLCCDLHNADAVRRIYEIKGRPSAMPLIAMLADMAQWPVVASSLPDHARALMQRWWPGPLTVIVPARADIPDIVLGGGLTIGMRIPDHPVTLQLLRAVGRPLATTSANRSGHPAPCTADAIMAELGSTVDLLLDAGPCPQGLASTVVDCTTVPPTLLREGPISRADLAL